MFTSLIFNIYPLLQQTILNHISIFEHMLYLTLVLYGFACKSEKNY